MSSALPFQPNEWSNIVKISVGPEEQLFEVHKHVLDTITFFRACLNSPFQESLNKTVQMPEDDVGAFNEVIQYAYFGHLSSNLTLIPKPTNQHLKERLRILRRNQVNLCLALQTYTLARKLGLEELPNKIMDTIDQYKRNHFGSSAGELSYIFETAQVEIIQRTYLLHHFAYVIRWHGWKTWKTSNIEHYGRFFRDKTSNVEEVLKVASKPQLSAPSLEREKYPCKWHVHVCSN